ncbi:hypothetical protein Ppa06_07130 [Planomonospora parontospora subsp. parontospora]|uniref:Uncharacterized protein n=1 Tax=Planomonospora parontospora subsp. parontospora TaxID=97194 RepID=A0ABQ4H460_9ACTN|nr:hypothetical protein Ppa06_07130 [Planomonospora parontospora subsp. parontospora]
MWNDQAEVKTPAKVVIIPTTKAGVAQAGIGHMVIPVTPAARRRPPQIPTPTPSLPMRAIDVPSSSPICRSGPPFRGGAPERRVRAAADR